MLKREAKPYERSRLERLRLAPSGMYLGVDLVSSGLVRLGEPPYPLSLEGFPSAAMASEPYAYRTPGQALLQSVKVVTEAGYDLKGVVFDNQFAGQVHLAGLCAQNVPFVARARLNQKVEVELEGEARRLSIRELGERYPPSKARYYKLIVLFSTLPTGVQEVTDAAVVLMLPSSSTPTSPLLPCSVSDSKNSYLLRFPGVRLSYYPLNPSDGSF